MVDGVLYDGIPSSDLTLIRIFENDLDQYVLLLISSKCDRFLSSCFGIFNVILLLVQKTCLTVHIFKVYFHNE